MRLFRSLALYTALVLGANATSAAPDALNALREGDMKKLNFHTEPAAPVTTGIQTFDGADMTLEAYRGKYVLLNFWATWCAPCRKEMPQLAQLQADFGSDRFDVVTVATGRNPPPAMKSFFADVGIDNLPLHRDPKQGLARSMRVFGLPMSVILDPDGREIARLRGEADWSSDSARAIIAALLAGG